MPPSRMQCCVVLEGTEVLEDYIASIITVKGISELGPTSAVTSNRHQIAAEFSEYEEAWFQIVVAVSLGATARLVRLSSSYSYCSKFPSSNSPSRFYFNFESALNKALCLNTTKH
jgi:hypothetical protein